MKRLLYALYVILPPAYAFAAAYVFAACSEYAARNYQYGLLCNFILPAVLFIGFGLLIAWKTLSKCIRSMEKKPAICLLATALLVQLVLMYPPITGGSSLILMFTNAIVMIYISFGVDLAMLIRNIRRPKPAAGDRPFQNGGV